MAACGLDFKYADQLTREDSKRESVIQQGEW